MLHFPLAVTEQNLLRDTCRYCCLIVCQWGILNCFFRTWWKHVLVMVSSIIWFNVPNFHRAILPTCGLLNPCWIYRLRISIIYKLLTGIRNLKVDQIYQNKISLNTKSFLIFKGTYDKLVQYLGVYFKKALFVPNISVYHKVGSHSLPPTDPQVDLSWQFSLQRVWENLMGNKGM